jgi:preprotein translocase subunit SecE
MDVSTQQDTRAAGALQLGVQKYLYTGYLVVGLAIAYITHQIVLKAWGEGHDNIATLVGVVVGLLAIVWGWKNNRVRTLAQETIDELSKVTWPTRQETYAATVVVVVTSIIAAVIIFGLDRFWSWFTDLIFR